MATRFIADKLNLDFAALAAALLIIIVVVVDCAGAWALGAAALRNSVAITDRLGLLEVGRRSLVVLIRDVGHFGSGLEEIGSRSEGRIRDSTRRVSLSKGASANGWGADS